jgi:5-methylcytosine-specific restriction endonuclease McrA
MNSPYYKIRFSVFNRDCFRCVYCGRSSTDDDKLVLNLEHMSPANGEEIDCELMSEDDLVTSCRECNVGKSNTILIDVDKIKQIKIDIKFRSVLRKYWEQEMKFKYPNFQVYYEGYIEKQIDKIKENLL